MSRRSESETNNSIIVIFSRQTITKPKFQTKAHRRSVRLFVGAFVRLSESKRQLHISGIEIPPLPTCFCIYLFSFACFWQGYSNSVSQLLRSRDKFLHPWEMKASHNTGNSVSYSFRTVCWFFYVPQSYEHWRVARRGLRHIISSLSKNRCLIPTSKLIVTAAKSSSTFSKKTNFHLHLSVVFWHLVFLPSTKHNNK